MRPAITAQASRRRRVMRLAAPVLLGVMILTGAASAATGSAWAAPTPIPSPGVPDPGVRPAPVLVPGTATTAPTVPVPVRPPPGTPAEPGTTITAPMPAPSEPAWSSPGDGGDPGLFDIPGQIRKAINDMLLWIAKTGLQPVMDTLGQTVLATPDLAGNPQIQAFWTTSLVAANGIFVLFVMAGGFIIAAHQSLQTSYGLKEIAPRVAVAGVAANVSLLVISKAIEAVNAVTAAIAGEGVDGHTAVTAISQMLTQPTTSTSLPPILFTLLILAALVMAIVVVMTFVVRVALLVLLIGIAPLALLCHATPQTEGLAHVFWRALAGCLGIQLGQAVIIAATVRIFLTPAGLQVLGVPATTGGLLAIVVCVTTLWLLIRLPGWMKHLILGPLGQRHGRGLVGQVLHAIIMIKTLGAVAGLGARASRPALSRGRSFPASPGRAMAPPPRTGTSPNRPIPGGSRSRPRTPSPARPVAGGRRLPAPGPAAFSSAPPHHTPLPRPVGRAGAPVFSSPAQSDTPRPAAAAPPAMPPFSHPSRPATAVPAAGARSAAVPFSHPSTPDTPRRRPGPAPAATFSAASPHTAPRRPPAPVSPVFSSPTQPAAAVPPSRPRPAATDGTSAVPLRPPPASPPTPPVRSRGRRLRTGGER